MSTRQFERTARQSVLDRLIDDPDHPEPRSWDESVIAFKNSVLRDLDWLLNARRVYPPAPESLDLVTRSIYHFGLRDLSSRSAASVETRSQLLREVQEAISTFEPRLSKVRVTLLQPPQGERRVSFQIEAELRTDPSPEAVLFETTLDVASKAMDVQERPDA